MQRKLLKSIEGDSMKEIKKWIARCENANIAPDDSDLEYARRKLEVLILRKGIVMCSLSVHVEINTVTSLYYCLFCFTRWQICINIHEDSKHNTMWKVIKHILTQ
jgi:hypothetical protein